MPHIWSNDNNNKKKNNRAVHPKAKLIVYMSRLNIDFEPKLEPKNIPNWPKKHPKWPKKVRKRPQMGDCIKNKNIGLYFQNQRWLTTYVGSKNVFEPDPDSKNSPKGPKNSPKGPEKSAKEAKVDCLHR